MGRHLENVSIRRSQRARHVRLVIKPAGIELVVPLHVNEAQAIGFLYQHREWAERKLTEIQGRAVADYRSCSSLPLESGSLLPFQGRDVPLIVGQHAGNRLKIKKLADGPFEILLPETSNLSPDLQIRSALFVWVKHWMRAEAHRLAQQHGQVLDLLPREIRIKRMKTRWGSCGPKDDINLNWLLAFTPPSVLEYVVVHELCHIRHRNHSREYWDLVSRHLPNWSHERRWLKAQGGELLRRFA
jgi:predicted metal-dependent hydrolase